MIDYNKLHTPEGYQPVKIEDINKGIVSKLFNRELKQVMKNIADVNTSAIDTRKITITIDIKPNKERNVASMNIAAKSHLASYMPMSTTIAFQKQNNGQLVPWESSLAQPDFDFNDNVQPINGTGE